MAKARVIKIKDSGVLIVQSSYDKTGLETSGKLGWIRHNGAPTVTVGDEIDAAKYQTSWSDEWD